jgi:hypothetical protein
MINLMIVKRNQNVIMIIIGVILIGLCFSISFQKEHYSFEATKVEVKIPEGASSQDANHFVSIPLSGSVPENHPISTSPSVASLGHNLYVVWNSHSKILIRISNDAGHSFQDPMELSKSRETNSSDPSVAIRGNNIYVVWSERGKAFTNGTVGGSVNTLQQGAEIMFAESNDGGKTFGDRINISHSPFSDSTRPRIIATENNVNVVWMKANVKEDAKFHNNTGTSDKDGHDEIFFSKKKIGTQKFSRPLNLTNPDIYSAINPSVAGDGALLTIVYSGGDEEDRDIYEVISSDSGNSFQSPIKLTHNGTLGASVQVLTTKISGRDTLNNQLSANDNQSYSDAYSQVIVTDGKGNGGKSDIYLIEGTIFVNGKVTGINNMSTLQRFGENRTTLGNIEITNISNDSKAQGDPVASRSKNLYVVWGSTDPMSNDLSFTVVNGHRDFSPAVTLNSDNTNHLVFDPTMTAFGDNVYIAWSSYDEDNRTSDISLRGSNDGGCTFGKILNLSIDNSQEGPNSTERRVKNLTTSNIVLKPPTADAGPDLTVNKGRVITLDGANSKDAAPGSSLTYSWSQIKPSNPVAKLNDPDTATPKFQAPTVTKNTVFVFKLIVTGIGGTDEDTMQVTVNSKGKPSNGGTGSVQNLAGNGDQNSGSSTSGGNEIQCKKCGQPDSGNGDQNTGSSTSGGNEIQCKKCDSSSPEQDTTSNSGDKDQTKKDTTNNADDQDQSEIPP